MKKRSILLSAVLAIAVCVSLIAGATYALFTSNSSVNIAITSGKVDVSATISDLTTTSMGETQEDGKWANGGEATVDGNNVTLAGITPGDAVSFNINIDNSKTTSKAKYRVSYQVENGYLLASGLDVTLSGITDGTKKYKTYASEWKDSVTQMTVTIALPAEAGDLYQGLTTAIAFSVEAVQANGVVNADAEYTLLPDNSAALEAAKENNLVVLEKGASLADALSDSADKYIVLTEDTVFTSKSGLNNVTIDANGNELFKHTTGIKSLTGTAVTLKNAVFNPGLGTGAQKDWGLYSEGVSYYNCVFNDYSPYIASTQDIIIDGCTFNNTVLQLCPNECGGVLPNSTVITNNVFNVNNTDIYAHGIVIGGGEKGELEAATSYNKEITIAGNTFNPVYADKTYVAYYVYGQAGVTLNSVRTFPKNTYNGLAMYSMNDITNQYEVPAFTASMALAEKMADETYTADGRRVPQGMTLDFSGEKCLVRIADEEAMLYYGHYFNSALACTARQEDIAAGIVKKSPLESKYFSGYNIWYASYYGPTTEVVIDNDMDFDGDVWNKPLTFYANVIDGQNHVFKNVNIKATGNAGQAGLFSGSATLQNFTVENVHADATEATGNSSCGVVVASGSASVRNITVKNSSAVGAKYAGGIAGYIYGTVANCEVINVTVDTTYKGGGLIGYQCADTSNGKTNNVENNVLENVSVACTQVLAGKTAALGVLVGNMNCGGNLIGNVAIGFTGATNAIGLEDSFTSTHEITSNIVNGEELN